MTLDDLLKLVPGVCRLRTLSADMLRILLDRQRHECTWCGDIVPKRRKTWCGDECYRAFRLRCDSAYVAQIVRERDNDLCQICGRDTAAAEREYRAIEQAQENKQRFRAMTWQEREAELLPLRRKFGWARGRFREVDHATPVVEYGGLCGPDELRLLCGECHAQVTAALAGRRAKKP